MYDYFTEIFNHITNGQVQWESYAQDEVNAHTLGGLSGLCAKDQAYWFTQKKMVSDVFVEDYIVHRVLRQFGR